MATIARTACPATDPWDSNRSTGLVPDKDQGRNHPASSRPPGNNTSLDVQSASECGSPSRGSKDNPLPVPRLSDLQSPPLLDRTVCTWYTRSKPSWCGSPARAKTLKKESTSLNEPHPPAYSGRGEGASEPGFDRLPLARRCKEKRRNRSDRPSWPTADLRRRCAPSPGAPRRCHGRR